MSRYSRKSKSELFASLLLELLLLLGSGAAFMFAVGVIHHEWIESCPTIGYGWSVLLASLLRTSLYLNDWKRADR